MSITTGLDTFTVENATRMGTFDRRYKTQAGAERAALARSAKQAGTFHVVQRHQVFRGHEETNHWEDIVSSFVNGEQQEKG